MVTIGLRGIGRLRAGVLVPELVWRDGAVDEGARLDRQTAS